ncbi:MAG: class IV adenylate cyclase [Candidatus Promineifilaceae bacterium]
MAGENNLEVEVKFLIEDLAQMQLRLAEAGAKIKKPRVHERNVRFDTADQALLAKEQLLRLREDSGVLLTFKGLSALDKQSEAKIREEIEVQLDSFDKMAAILSRLGYSPQQTYEKYRETFELGEVEVVVDEMPYGNFVELEGREDALKTAARALGLNWEERIVSNYLALMGYLIQHYDLPFDDVTFANFEASKVSIRDILPLVPQS